MKCCLILLAFKQLLQIQANERSLFNWLCAMETKGICLLTGAPKEPGQVAKDCGKSSLFKKNCFRVSGLFYILSKTSYLSHFCSKYCIISKLLSLLFQGHIFCHCKGMTPIMLLTSMFLLVYTPISPTSTYHQG